MNELEKQFSAMVAGLVKPGTDIIATLTPEKAHLWHMATGLSGEVAELLKAWVEYNRENLLEECGDVLFYAEATCQFIQTTLHVVPVTRSIRLHREHRKQNLVFCAGEVVDAVKRHVVYGKDLDFQRVLLNIQQLVEDVDWFLDWFSLSRSDALAHNYAKLGKRYQGHKYTDAQAIARNDKAGGEE